MNTEGERVPCFAASAVETLTSGRGGRARGEGEKGVGYHVLHASAVKPLIWGGGGQGVPCFARLRGETLAHAGGRIIVFRGQRKGVGK